MALVGAGVRWLRFAMLGFSLPVGVAFFEYGSNVHALKTTSDFKRWVTNSSYLVMVNFYREGCGFCKLLEDPWEKSATDLKHMVHFCAIDTEKAPALAAKASQKYGIEIKGVPTIVAFTPKSKTPLPYNGERTAPAIKGFASSTMPDFVTRLSPKTLPAWLDYSVDSVRKILLFSEKSAPATLLKAISSEFRGRVSFGLAPKSSFGILAEEYGVNSFPALVALRRPEDEFEEDRWIQKNFGDTRHAVLHLAGGAKPSFRSLEFWVMPFARAPRSKKYKPRTSSRTDL
mmetsp:Transcript_22217/g.66499  ORF Transcript_22217/g.66499 Transcript_22217/m.66499 type:complete len:287 (-) Transcript_22217:45-905(-)